MGEREAMEDGELFLLVERGQTLGESMGKAPTYTKEVERKWKSGNSHRE